MATGASAQQMHAMVALLIPTPMATCWAQVGAELVFVDRDRKTVYMRLLYRAAEIRSALQHAAHDPTSIPTAELHRLEAKGEQCPLAIRAPLDVGQTQVTLTGLWQGAPIQSYYQTSSCIDSCCNF